MFAAILGATVVGINGTLVQVEIDLANGLPGMEIVGLPDTSVRESKERVRAAIRNSGFEYPTNRITINLAPADLRKDGSGLDLAIAIGILVAAGSMKTSQIANVLFVGELSLDGRLRGVPGVLPIALMCRTQGIETLIVSKDNEMEAVLVHGVMTIGAACLSDVVAYLNGETIHCENSVSATAEMRSNQEDFRDVGGQVVAKRALEIAAAGGHNVLMSGPPGAGKTMLARRMPSILPEMSLAEALEVTKIHSVAGLLSSGSGMVMERPFRAPHHTASSAAMVGGGRFPKPGEVTLAHHGVLFLDEMPEFPRQVLEVLRQPLEDGEVTVARAAMTLKYPARFVLIGAMNPCPCGFAGDSSKECSCSPIELKKYMRRISGPLLDRMDMFIQVASVSYNEVAGIHSGESSAEIKDRVAAARVVQQDRLAKEGLYCNSQMNHRQLRQYCRLEPAAEKLLRLVFERNKLNARSLDRLIKVGRTIADLEHSDLILEAHVAEAIQLRLRLQEDG